MSPEVRSRIVTDRDARLDAIRREIDALDAELLELLNRRGRAVLEVASVKSREAEPRYYRPEREAALLRRLAAMNEGPLPDAEAMRLFREIVSTCRTLEQRLVVGCTTVGEACAAAGHFGGAVEVHAAPDTPEAAAAVAASHYDYAVIEFSPAGAASPDIADLPRWGLALCGEWYARDGRRYVVIGHEPVPPTGDDWTSLVVSTRAGGDHRVLVRRLGSAPAFDSDRGPGLVVHRRGVHARGRIAAHAARCGVRRRGPGRVSERRRRRAPGMSTAATERPAQESAQ